MSSNSLFEFFGLNFKSTKKELKDAYNMKINKIKNSDISDIDKSILISSYDAYYNKCRNHLNIQQRNNKSKRFFDDSIETISPYGTEYPFYDRSVFDRSLFDRSLFDRSLFDNSVFNRLLNSDFTRLNNLENNLENKSENISANKLDSDTITPKKYNSYSSTRTYKSHMDLDGVKTVYETSEETTNGNKVKSTKAYKTYSDGKVEPLDINNLDINYLDINYLDINKLDFESRRIE